MRIATDRPPNPDKFPAYLSRLQGRMVSELEKILGEAGDDVADDMGWVTVHYNSLRGKSWTLRFRRDRGPTWVTR